MPSLGLYRWMSQWKLLNYRAKIMLMAFIGTHVPLLALIAYFVIQSTSDLEVILSTIGVALVATLLGTAATLLVLNQLLKPVLLTSKALRVYREERRILPLPTDFRDEAGTLMADAAHTMMHLEVSLDSLEHTDPVTGLPNRKKFVAQLAERMAQGAEGTVAAIRFENYDRLVEAYDQEAADAAIRRLAARLHPAIVQGAELARVESNTFAVLSAPEGGDDTLADGLGRLLNSVSGELSMPRFSILPDLRAGLTSYHKRQAATPEALLDDAIAAAGASVRAGSIQRHSPQLRQAARDRFDLEQEMRRGLQNDEFVLNYQPVVDLAAGRVVGAEALVRWHHPERGVVAPGIFIPVAEATGLIEPLGNAVIGKAFDQLSSWKGEAFDDFRVAINLSARQFSNPKTTGMIRDSLRNSALDGGRIEVELTETAAMADYEYTRSAFKQLKDLGVSIAIDDFGTGYASMSYLRKLTFDKLKIDREFVSNVDASRESQAICAALVALADGLGLSVLAEGTEREAEIAHLRSIGCNLFQGYYFSRPVPASEFEEVVRDISLLTAQMTPTRNREARKTA